MIDLHGSLLRLDARGLACALGEGERRGGRTPPAARGAESGRRARSARTARRDRRRNRRGRRARDRMRSAVPHRNSVGMRMRCSRPLQLGIVHVGRPGERARALRGCAPRPAPRLRHRLVVALAGGRIEIGERVELRLGHREDVDDVAGLAVADLDADGVGQHQVRQPRGRLHRDLGRDPAAERRRRPPATSRRSSCVEQVEIEIGEVVDACRTPSAARSGRSPDAIGAMHARAARQRVEHRRGRLDADAGMQEQERPAARRARSAPRGRRLTVIGETGSALISSTSPCSSSRLDAQRPGGRRELGAQLVDRGGEFGRAAHVDDLAGGGEPRRDHRVGRGHRLACPRRCARAARAACRAARTRRWDCPAPAPGSRPRPTVGTSGALGRAGGWSPPAP